MYGVPRIIPQSFKLFNGVAKIIKKIKDFILEVGENIWKSVESGFFPFGH